MCISFRHIDSQLNRKVNQDKRIGRKAVERTWGLTPKIGYCYTPICYSVVVYCQRINHHRNSKRAASASSKVVLHRQDGLYKDISDNCNYIFLWRLLQNLCMWITVSRSTYPVIWTKITRYGQDGSRSIASDYKIPEISLNWSATRNTVTLIWVNR